jgi:uncharacterized protein (DUF433 family)
MSTTPVSIRLDDEVLALVQADAKTQPTTVSSVIQTLLWEALRSRAVPGIAFRKGPSGRRPAIVRGPDVWEIVQALKNTEEHGDKAIATVAADLSLSESQVNAALDYYAHWPTEIDAWIADNERASDDAFRAWHVKQSILS